LNDSLFIKSPFREQFGSGCRFYFVLGLCQVLNFAGTSTVLNDIFMIYLSLPRSVLGQCPNWGHYRFLRRSSNFLFTDHSTIRHSTT